MQKVKLFIILTATLLFSSAVVTLGATGRSALPSAVSSLPLTGGLGEDGFVVKTRASGPAPGQQAGPAPTALPEISGSIVRVTVPGVLENQVVPSGNRAPEGELIGQYSVAAEHGSIGLLAHNYLEGAKFYDLTPGMRVYLETSTGQTIEYQVTNIMRFQASNPDDYSKPFFDEAGNRLTAWELFQHAYLPGVLTFQTCISGEGTTTWGVMIVQAERVDDSTRSW
jgi:hypothetical protein